MAKRKTQRRWNGAGDGLVHAYEIHKQRTLLPFRQLGTGRIDFAFGKIRIEFVTFCRINMFDTDRGIWCRKPITCIACLSYEGVRGKTAHAGSID